MEKIETKSEEEVVNTEEKVEKNTMDNFTNIFYYGQAKSALRNYAGKYIDEYNLFDSNYSKVNRKHFENFYLKNSNNSKDVIKVTYLNRKLFRIDILNKHKNGSIDDKYEYVENGIHKISFNNIKNTISISKKANGKLITNIYKDNEIYKTFTKDI